MLGHHHASQNQRATHKMLHTDATNVTTTSAANKTLPLSIFEMQFYQGDFILQQ